MKPEGNQTTVGPSQHRPYHRHTAIKMGILDDKFFLYTCFPRQGSFALIPQATIFLNVILAAALSQITQEDRDDVLERAQTMIGLVSTASISIVTLTFSLTVLSIQIASQTYTPRLLDDFLKDPVSKVVISVNVGAFAYCFTMTYFIYDQNKVPVVAINLMSVHMFFVLTSFVGFVHFFLNGMRLEKILTRSRESSLTAFRNFDSNYNTDLRELPEVPPRAYKVMADSNGYVVAYKLESILSLATELDICVRFHPQIGEFVVEGTLLAYVWDAKTRPNVEEKSLNQIVQERFGPSDQGGSYRSEDERVEEMLGTVINRGIDLSKKRSSNFDETLGVQQLADIAVRALSPGINDPQTCVQAMDVLFVLFAGLAGQMRGYPNKHDDQDVLRVCCPRRKFAYLLSQLDSIRHYGASDLAVCRRGIRLFGELGAILTRTNKMEHRIPSILTQLDQWMEVSKRNFPKGSDELRSLEALYRVALSNIKGSESPVLEDNEEVQTDLQELETTHAPKEEGREDGGMLKKVASAVGIIAS
jgi:uncharacterized membrane protein